MIRLSLIGAALALIWAGPALAQTSSVKGFEPQVEDPVSYPDFPGREEAVGFCAACHAFRLVAQQGMTRDQWDSSLTWMTDRHGMPKLEPADRDLILGYLVRAFPPHAPVGGRAGWRSPFQPTP